MQTEPSTEELDEEIAATKVMIWTLSHRCDPRAKPVADRHYNRQTPESPQFMPPGRCLVLYSETENGEAVWGTSWPFAEYVKHEWAGAWVNSLFRNENAGLSSQLIRQAVAATKWRWPQPPGEGMITFVDSTEVGDGKPGYCYECAGFSHVAYTKGGLHAWELAPSNMPDASPPKGSTQNLNLRHA